MTTAAAFRQQVTVFVSRTMSPAARSRALAETARAGVADLVRSRRASPLYRRFVDGQEGVPEGRVRPDGEILYEFQYLQEVVAFALEYLRQRAPVARMTSRNYDRQAYKDSFYLGLDGKFLMARNWNPATMGNVREVVVGNTRPYQRKVEVQYVGTRKLRYSVPPGLFSDCAQEIRRRFGNHVEAKWVYTMLFPGIYRLKNPQFRRKPGGGRRIGRRAGVPVESPAIVITVR